MVVKVVDATEAAQPAETAESTRKISPEVATKIAAMRSQAREVVGTITLAMIALPRYRHQSIQALQHLLIDPFVRDRVAIAYPDADDNQLTMAGFAIWASVSDDVEKKILEQIAEGVFPVRLNPNDWRSGETNWLFDIVAPTPRAEKAVLANFRSVVPNGPLKMHPLIAQRIGEETLAMLGAKSLKD